MKDWKTIYRDDSIIQKELSPQVLEAIEFLKDGGFNRVLDLGCGTGRHTVLLAQGGFDVYGCDFSQEALDIVSQQIPEGHFTLCDMTTLPYENDFFDAILCNHVLQHGMLADVKRAIGEMNRVLRSGGCLFLVVLSTEHPKFLTGYEVEPNTRMDTDDIDGHEPHHFFTEEEMRVLFDEFELVRIEHFKGPSELDPAKESVAWGLYARKR